MTVGELNVEIGAKLTKLEKSLDKMEREIKGSSKKSERVASQSFNKIGGVIAAAFSIDAIVGFSREVIRVRSEFEKFEAVLTNTLGSNSAAQLALSDIKAFAAETPFSVQELTGSFVKLANQGFKPTIAEMRKLGDLAASTGKGFDQLAEAIIDAQVGEFERLKEFGVRAQAQGDQVQFTFKGVQTTVDRTSESIQQYLLGLGDLNGVQGATAAISETLAGKVSNLGDKYDNLLNTIGDTSVWKGLIDGMGGALEATTSFIQYLQSDGITSSSKWNTILSFISGNMAAVVVDVTSGNAAVEASNRAVIEGRAAMEEYASSIVEVSKAASTFNESFVNLKDLKLPSIIGGEDGSALQESANDALIQTTDNLAMIREGLDQAAAAGDLFGGVLQSSFEASLINGESFFETFSLGLKNMIKQLIAAAAASAILAGIISAIVPGLGFKASFGSVDGGISGEGGDLGGFFRLLGTDLIASTGRSEGQQARFN